MSSPYFEDYIHTLPSPGSNGTLSANMKNSSAEVKARIKVKSGSMEGVRCYSGYVLPADFSFKKGMEIPAEVRDRIIIFSIMTNNCTSPTWKVRPLLDKMMAALAQSN
jgi:D-alanyl-D-alanine carboxypeptidase/D-alanyl-D-alanine-endopeptidase (penicillin-binding protein 4)